MMRPILLLLAITVALTTAFAPGASRVHSALSSPSGAAARRPATNLYQFGEEDNRERKGLTRDSEPEEFFSTNTDKMSDSEKIPIAIAGLVGISLPFIAGLIALYSAK